EPLTVAESRLAWQRSRLLVRTRSNDTLESEVPMSLSSLDGPISRRQFLKRGAALGAGAVAASMIWDSLWGRAVLAGPGKGMPMVADFLTRAQVTELLGHALAHGGDFAEVYGEYTLQTLLTVDQGKLASMEYGVL